MHFSFTEEQNLIRDSTAAFLKDFSTRDAVGAAMETELGYDPNLWSTICQEMYWQRIHIPEAYGGLGLSYVELVGMMEQMGQTLFCSPFFATVCLGANALLVAGNEAQKTTYLAQISSGKTAAFAYTGAQASRGGGRWHIDAIDAVARPAPGGYLIHGDWSYVVDGHSADIIIVATSEPAAKVSFFVVTAATQGLNKSVYPTMDQTRRLASLSARDLFVPEAQRLEYGDASKLDKIIDLALVALSAEQLGGAQRTLDMSLAYAMQRKQFNRPIASFQAIKHKAADMLTRVEAARSGVYYAACIAVEATQAEGTSVRLMEAAAIANSTSSDAYFANAAAALQIHGGVGFTWEYDVHLHLKRAKSSEHLLGNGDYHRERLAAYLLDGVPDGITL